MNSAKWVCLEIVMAIGLAVAQGRAQQGQGQQNQTQAAQFRVVKAVSGSKGEEHGNDFVITDSRTLFRIPDDKQVIVFFEWEGPLGMHKFEGTWKSPDGNVISDSSFEKEVRASPFQAHWTLVLPEKAMPGLWEFAAQIDGQPAGAYAVRIRMAESAAPVGSHSEGDVYLRAADGMVYVESLDKDGVRLNRGSGFFITPKLVLTAFENIEGASAVRVELPGGGQQKLTEVAGWNRSVGWALLQVDAPNTKELAIAKSPVWKIGHVNYLMDAPQEGGRALKRVEIKGMRDVAGASKRIYISWVGDKLSVGSPLMDLEGDVVGMLGGESMAGVDAYVSQSRIAGNRPGVPEGMASLMVVPITEVAPIPPKEKPVALAAMADQGLFETPFAGDSLIITGSLCSTFEVVPKRGPVCKGVSGVFSKKLQNVTAFVEWSWAKDQKLTEELRIYDSENRKVGEPVLKEVKLKQNQPNPGDCQFPIAFLTPGVYRLDLVVGGKVQWRTNFIVTE